VLIVPDAVLRSTHDEALYTAEAVVDADDPDTAGAPMVGLRLTCPCPRNWAATEGLAPIRATLCRRVRCLRSVRAAWVSLGVEPLTLRTQPSSRAWASARPGHGAFGLSLALDLHAPHLARAEAEDLMLQAHERCPYSNATRGNVDVVLKVDGVDVEPLRFPARSVTRSVREAVADLRRARIRCPLSLA